MSSPNSVFVALLGAHVLAVVVLVLMAVMGAPAPAPAPKVKGGGGRAFFVFGDSLVDNGNNNFLLTPARADSPPYGIDSPSHRPTGRFSNGLNIPDIISEELGLEPTLPYLSPKLQGEKLLVGANFASAGIGILNDTGFQFVNIIRIYQQFELFRQYQERVKSLIGAAKTEQLVKGGLALIVLGGNDFVNNYFLTSYSLRRFQFSLPQFARYIVSEYRRILMRLYDLGARMVMVSGTGPLGCVPGELATKSQNGACAEEPQQGAEIFNKELAKMLKELNKIVGSDVFISVNAMEMHSDFISNPQAFGFSETKKACCGQGPFNGLGICNPTSNLCSDRSSYAYWDAFHPTERANRYIVKQMLNGSKKYMQPMNLSTIMSMEYFRI